MNAELSKLGSAIERSFVMVDGAFAYNHYYLSAEWERVYMASHYQGCWKNKQTLQICCYTEGDVVTVSCKDAMTFNSEVIDHQTWFADNA